jgi:uncharacterized membrane protein
MEFNGIPLHPLVVHAVVVFAPLAALSAVLYAAMPRWRWALRWPLVATALISVVTAYVATLSGADLAESRYADALPPAVQAHKERGELLRNVLIAFTVAAGLAAWRLGGPSALKSGRGERPTQSGAVDVLVTGLLVVGALAVVVLVFRAGDSGARNVWGV